MSDKDRICIEVFHRDEYSLGKENRQRLGWAIYHWAILVRPKIIHNDSKCTSYDTTDAVLTTVDRGKNLNPNNDWRFRVRENVHPLNTGHFLVAVDIAKLPKNRTREDIEGLLARTALPQQGRSPVQNCVTWIRTAIGDLQRAGLVEDVLDADKVMLLALQKADLVVLGGPPRKATDRFIDLDIVRREIARMPRTPQESHSTMRSS